ncbi:hypothetical protein EDB89DRAFT_403671 [Lactarius sanguifluus]|nr:hypothetical protein EDB89DRAFT_403671 [Lactarius sanguifluus]
MRLGAGSEVAGKSRWRSRGSRPSRRSPAAPLRPSRQPCDSPIIIVINLLLSLVRRHLSQSCTCILSHQPRLFFCQCQSAFVVISSLSYALSRPPFFPYCPPTGLLRSGLLSVLAGGAAMPIGPSFLAARSHGTLALHLYIHSTPPSKLTYLTPTFACATVFTHPTTAHHVSPRPCCEHLQRRRRSTNLCLHGPNQQHPPRTV